MISISTIPPVGLVTQTFDRSHYVMCKCRTRCKPKKKKQKKKQNIRYHRIPPNVPAVFCPVVPATTNA